MNNEFEKLEVFYLQSTFIKDCCDYIKSRDDYSLVKNIRNLLKIDTTFNKQDLIKVKEFYENYFKVKDIVYSPQRLPMSKYFRNKKIAELGMISPFDVPVNFYDYIITSTKDYDKISSSVDGGIIPYKKDNIRYVKKLSLVLTKVVLGSYIHEITHTQQTFLNSPNDEMIPIFIELIFANYFDEFNLRKYLRLNNVLNNLEFIDCDYVRFPHDELLVANKYDAIKYTESTLKAFMLYFIYTNEQLSSKKAQIIDGIQDCFDNKLSVREFLNRNDIKEDNYKSLSLIRQYFK